MRIRSAVLVLALLLGVCAVAVAEEHMNMPAAKSSPTFDRLKSLVGSWQGKTADGKDVKASYQMVSGGTCLMETLDTPDGMSMITMYHMDCDRLVLDHYCALNNVPRMKAAASAD